jgi:predicted DCC family thiol-disulfide oxidoreductase YuxK
MWLVPLPLLDWYYRVFARYRYRLFGQYDECVVPTPEQRARFVS